MPDCSSGIRWQRGGFAFGQGLVDSLHMEWQIWSDSTGEDLINAYPLASAERSYTDKKVTKKRKNRPFLKNVQPAFAASFGMLPGIDFACFEALSDRAPFRYTCHRSGRKC